MKPNEALAWADRINDEWDVVDYPMTTVEVVKTLAEEVSGYKKSENTSHPKDDYEKLKEYCRELDKNLYRAIDRIRELEEEVLIERERGKRIWCDMVEGEKDLQVIIRDLTNEVRNYKELLKCHEDDLK